MKKFIQHGAMMSLALAANVSLLSLEDKNIDNELHQDALIPLEKVVNGAPADSVSRFYSLSHGQDIDISQLDKLALAVSQGVVLLDPVTGEKIGLSINKSIIPYEGAVQSKTTQLFARQHQHHINSRENVSRTVFAHPDEYRAIYGDSFLSSIEAFNKIIDDDGLLNHTIPTLQYNFGDDLINVSLNEKKQAQEVLRGLNSELALESFNLQIFFHEYGHTLNRSEVAISYVNALITERQQLLTITPDEQNSHTKKRLNQIDETLNHPKYSNIQLYSEMVADAYMVSKMHQWHIEKSPGDALTHTMKLLSQWEYIRRHDVVNALHHGDKVTHDTLPIMTLMSNFTEEQWQELVASDESTLRLKIEATVSGLVKHPAYQEYLSEQALVEGVNRWKGTSKTSINDGVFQGSCRLSR